jgi:hypothetical protein
MRYFFFFLIMVFVISCVHTTVTLLTESEDNKLKTAAGDKWAISSYKDEIVLESKELCWFYGGVSLPPMDEKELREYAQKTGRKDHYVITLLFVPRWSAEKMAEARQHNNNIRLQMAGLAKKHGLTHLTPNKMNSFFPETEEDKVKIKKYEEDYAQLHDQLIEIPEYYSESYSIFWQDNREGFELVWTENLNIKKISEVFTRY